MRSVGTKERLHLLWSKVEITRERYGGYSFGKKFTKAKILNGQKKGVGGRRNHELRVIKYEIL